MKEKKNLARQLIRQWSRAGLMVITMVVVTLEATSLLQYSFSRKGMRDEATMRAESQMEATQNKIMDVINQGEAAVRNSIWIASWCLNAPDSLQRVAQRIVEDNPVVVGSTVALVPGYLRDRPLYSPYVFKGPDSTLRFASLATQEYDYPHQEWFAKALECPEGYWSEPYIDVGGGDILMTTFSMPIKDYRGKTAAVLTADISLDWLTDLVGNLSVYPNAFNMVISRTGHIMVSPVEEMVMTKTLDEVISELDDTATFGPLNRAMLSGEAGNMQVKYKGLSNYVYFAPVERTGWAMSIVIPEDEVFGNLKRVGLMVTILQILGILMLILMFRSMFNHYRQYKDMNDKKERMENELSIASDIQMSMIPKIFPPFPERTDLDMSAAIVPAKEVGGDLYDFYIRDEKLFFCVGDVSGKGVPASLVMAVTRSIFRSISAHEDSPGRILTIMNGSMADTNENNMFVTLFLGVLDLESGHLRYCNAGHNAPMILTDHIDMLPVEANLPLGIVADHQFTEQEIDIKYDDALFLYTDGLTEAENISHELFGEQRVKAALHGRKSAEDHLRTIQATVKEFVGDAPQSDDLTMLFIHYLSDGKRHHLTMRNDLDDLSKLHALVETVAQESGLSGSMQSSLELALEEAVVNVMKYAYPEGTTGLVNMEAIERPGELEFILSDSGKPFNPLDVPEADVTLGVEDRKIGGLGIFLVRQIMTDVGYEWNQGRNVLSMKIKL